MKCFSPFKLVLISAWLLGVWAANAQTLINPSFETDDFTVSPGYVADNGPITGWTVTTAGPANIGIDGNFNVFTDNGAIPEGTHAAFMEAPISLTPDSLSQVVSDFVVGKKYRVRYYENATDTGTWPGLSVRLGGSTVVPLHLVGPVGGTNLYREVISAGLTATNTSLELAFLITSPGGGTRNVALIDDVSIFAPTEIVVSAAVPSGPGVSANAVINITLEEFNTKLDTNSIQLTFNAHPVVPIVTQTGDLATIQYDPPGSLPSASSNAIQLIYADASTPPVWSTNRFSFVVKTSPVSGAYTNAVLADNPLVYWRLNETNGPTAFDSSGKGNDGAYRLQAEANSGSLTTQAGPPVELGNTAVVFNGTTENVFKSLPLGGDYTVEFWFNNTRPFNALPITGYPFGRGTAFDSVGIGGSAVSLGQLFFFNGVALIGGTTALSLNRWYHVAMVRSGASVTLYLNGQPEASGTADAPFGDDVTLGIRSDLNWAFQGGIDEVALYETALSAQQILAHWDAVLEPPAEIKLSIVRSADDVVLTWTGDGVLEEAAQVTGPWTPVEGGTTGSYTAAISGASKFYRARQP